MSRAECQVWYQGRSLYASTHSCDQRYKVSDIYPSFQFDLTSRSLALSNWLDQLPHSLALIGPAPSNALPHILMMHLSHAWLVILLNRPFYRPLARLPASSTNEVEATRANQAAWAVKVRLPIEGPN